MGYIIRLTQVASKSVPEMKGFLVDKEIKQIKSRTKRFLVSADKSAALVFATAKEADSFAWPAFSKSRVVYDYQILQDEPIKEISHSYCKWKV